MLVLLLEERLHNMSYFSIRDFVIAGRKSLKDENYWSALTVALALPSMCSRLAFKNNPDKYRNWKWVDRSNHAIGKTYSDWKDKKCYVDFCNATMRVNQGVNSPQGEPDGWLVSSFGMNFSEVLYDLRCDIIHVGSANIYDGNKSLYLALGGTTSTDLSKYRVININELCLTIFEHIESWYINFNNYDILPETYVFDTDNSNDDRLLLKKLCDKDRADLLLNDFQSHDEKRRNQKNADN